jgi:hypothetical protein
MASEQCRPEGVRQVPASFSGVEGSLFRVNPSPRLRLGIFNGRRPARESQRGNGALRRPFPVSSTAPHYRRTKSESQELLDNGSGRSLKKAQGYGLLSACNTRCAKAAYEETQRAQRRQVFDVSCLMKLFEEAKSKNHSEAKRSKPSSETLVMASNVSIREKISEVREQGFCILRNHFAPFLVEACRRAFWPRLLTHLNKGSAPNRGPHRYFFAMPFEPPIFTPQFFFDDDVLCIVRGLMDDRIVADQWSCDVPLRGSEYQEFHVDYQRPLFPEVPDLALPAYALVVSFGLVRIGRENGPIEIAPGTHRMTRMEGLRAVEGGQIGLQAVPMDIGDVLIRHPRALHRGTPNATDVPRALATIRYVRRWYADASRDVDDVPSATYESLTADQQGMMRFPQAGRASAECLDGP